MSASPSLIAACEAQPLLDESVLAVLVESVGEDMVGTMLAMIPEEAEASILAIDAAVRAGDMCALRQAAHGLKGFAANFGASRITALARALEQDVVDTDAAQDLVPYLSRVVADTSALIAAR